MTFEKTLFKTSAVSHSDLTISSFFVRFILSLETDLSDIKDFTVSRNCSLHRVLFMRMPKFQ